VADRIPRPHVRADDLEQHIPALVPRVLRPDLGPGTTCPGSSMLPGQGT
jgi:hypothetical protein